jgi:hypothetical protein
MFRHLPRAIFRGVFKPILLAWLAFCWYVVQLLFRGSSKVHLVGCKCN